jgi:hypothetical protein
MMKMTYTWLNLWRKFLALNPNYKGYCDARRRGDKTKCAELESQFQCVAELYDDWGDFYQVHFDYKKWIEPRRELYFRTSIIRWVEDSAGYVPRAGHMLIELPLADEMSQTVATFKAWIKFAYEMRDEVVKSSTRPLARLANEPLPQPKYMLHDPRGRLNAASLATIRKAAYVVHVGQDSNMGGLRSATETVLAIKQGRNNPLGWSMTTDDINALARGTFAKSILDSSEVTQVKRYRKDFKAYVANTIHGRFPDNT